DQVVGTGISGPDEGKEIVVGRASFHDMVEALGGEARGLLGGPASHDLGVDFFGHWAGYAYLRNFFEFRKTGILVQDGGGGDPRRGGIPAARQARPETDSAGRQECRPSLDMRRTLLIPRFFVNISVDQRESAVPKPDSGTIRTDQVETKVDGPNGMRQGPHRDEIDPGPG